MPRLATPERRMHAFSGRSFRLPGYRSPANHAPKMNCSPLADLREAFPIIAYLAGVVGAIMVLLRVLPPEYATALEQYLSAIYR